MTFASEADVRDYLAMLGGLVRAARDGTPSDWSPDQWWRMLRTLTPRERHAVIGLFLLGKSKVEIAQEWGTSRGLPWMVIQRAITRLRRHAERRPQLFEVET